MLAAKCFCIEMSEKKARRAHVFLLYFCLFLRERSAKWTPRDTRKLPSTRRTKTLFNGEMFLASTPRFDVDNYEARSRADRQSRALWYTIDNRSLNANASYKIHVYQVLHYARQRLRNKKETVVLGGINRGERIGYSLSCLVCQAARRRGIDVEGCGGFDKGCEISLDAKYSRRVNTVQSRGTELISKLLNLHLTFPPAEEFHEKGNLVTSDKP